MVKIWRAGPKMYYGASELIRGRAKDLRKRLTPAEKELWKHISNKQLGARFRQQHPIRSYIADFFCPELELVIEVDGGIHLSKEQQENDSSRDAVMTELELHILRFTNDDVLNRIESVKEKIRDKIESLKLARI